MERSSDTLGVLEGAEVRVQAGPRVGIKKDPLNHQIQSPFSPVSDMPARAAALAALLSASDFLSDFLWHRILAQAIDTMRKTNGCLEEATSRSFV